MNRVSAQAIHLANNSCTHSALPAFGALRVLKDQQRQADFPAAVAFCGLRLPLVRVGPKAQHAACSRQRPGRAWVGGACAQQPWRFGAAQLGAARHCQRAQQPVPRCLPPCMWLRLCWAAVLEGCTHGLDPKPLGLDPQKPYKTWLQSVRHSSCTVEFLGFLLDLGDLQPPARDEEAVPQLQLSRCILLVSHLGLATPANRYQQASREQCSTSPHPQRAPHHHHDTHTHRPRQRPPFRAAAARATPRRLSAPGRIVQVAAGPRPDPSLALAPPSAHAAAGPGFSMKRKGSDAAAGGGQHGGEDCSLCDVCSAAAPTVVCEEDHARLCGSCDAQVRRGGCRGASCVGLRLSPSSCLLGRPGADGGRLRVCVCVPRRCTALTRWPTGTRGGRSAASAAGSKPRCGEGEGELRWGGQACEGPLLVANKRSRMVALTSACCLTPHLVRRSQKTSVAAAQQPGLNVCGGCVSTLPKSRKLQKISSPLAAPELRLPLVRQCSDGRGGRGHTAGRHVCVCVLWWAGPGCSFCCRRVCR